MLTDPVVVPCQRAEQDLVEPGGASQAFGAPLRVLGRLGWGQDWGANVAWNLGGKLDEKMAENLACSEEVTEAWKLVGKLAESGGARGVVRWGKTEV